MRAMHLQAHIARDSLSPRWVVDTAGGKRWPWLVIGVGVRARNGYGTKPT